MEPTDFEQRDRITEKCHDRADRFELADPDLVEEVEEEQGHVQGSRDNRPGDNPFLGREWHHIAFVRETSGTGVIYVDGTCYSTGIMNCASPTSGTLLIGRDAANPTPQFFRGAMQQMKWFASELTQQDIQNEMAADDPPPIDHDADNMGDCWEMTYGLDPTNPADAYAPAYISGTTGLTNLAAYQQWLAAAPGQKPNSNIYYPNPPTLTIMSTPASSGTQNTILRQPLVVKLTDSNNVAFANAPVQFTATGGGHLSLDGTNLAPRSNSITVLTDSQGIAQMYLWLSPTTGINVLTASAGGTNGAVVTFTATAAAPAAPDAVLNLTATANASGTGADISWIGATTGAPAGAYYIYRANPGETDWTQLTLVGRGVNGFNSYYDPAGMLSGTTVLSNYLILPYNLGGMGSGASTSSGGPPATPSPTPPPLPEPLGPIPDSSTSAIVNGGLGIYADLSVHDSGEPFGYATLGDLTLDSGELTGSSNQSFPWYTWYRGGCGRSGYKAGDIIPFNMNLGMIGTCFGQFVYFSAGSVSMELFAEYGQASGQIAAPIFTLDIDADNNNGFQMPDRNDAEQNGPGKIITVAGDTDNSGVPDWAKGYTGAQKSDPSPYSQFVPIIFEVKNTFYDQQDGTFKFYFDYDASPPNEVTKDTNGVITSSTGGHFRLWKKNGNEQRTLDDYIKPVKKDQDGNPIDNLYSWEDLFPGGDPAPGGKITLFVEMVPNEVQTICGNTITVTGTNLGCFATYDDFLSPPTNRALLDNVVTSGTLLPVQVMKVWSDQLPGVEANYLADAKYNGFDSIGTGWGNKTYIFQGAAQSWNYDGKGHIKAQVAMSGSDSIKNKILWRLSKNGVVASGSSSYAAYDGTTQVVSVTIDNPADDDTTNYILVGGYDADGDNQLSSAEANIIPKCLYTTKKGTQYLPFSVKIVSTKCYNDSITSLKNKANGWRISCPHAAGLLNSFASGNLPVESGTSEAITIDRLESGLDHPVGILFDASTSSTSGLPKAGPGPSITAVFDEGTKMAIDVANSITMNTWLQSQLGTLANHIAIVQYFAAHPDQQSARFSYQLSGDLDYNNVIEDYDLWFAFGKVSVTVTASVLVDRSCIASEITLTGDMIDLYDFDFDGAEAALVHPAASVQAGYNTLGNGGRVFKSRVHMNNTVLVDFML